MLNFEWIQIKIYLGLILMFDLDWKTTIWTYGFLWKHVFFYQISGSEHHNFRHSNSDVNFPQFNQRHKKKHRYVNCHDIGNSHHEILQVCEERESYRLHMGLLFAYILSDCFSLNIIMMYIIIFFVNYKGIKQNYSCSLMFNVAIFLNFVSNYHLLMRMKLPVQDLACLLFIVFVCCLFGNWAIANWCP